MTISSKIINLSSILFRRAQLATQIGKTFDGDRDIYKTLGYKRSLDFIDYSERFQRGGIAAKIVSTYPITTWRHSPIIREKNNLEETEFTEAWNTLEKRLKVYHYLSRTDVISGIGQFAVLLIGTKTSRVLKEQIQKVNDPDDVIFLSPYSQGNAEIFKFEKSPTSPRFGLPDIYKLNLTTEDMDNNSSHASFNNKLEVHHSRIIHIADGLNEDDIFGTPRMRPVWNYLDDLDKTVGGGAEGIWRTAVPGLQFDIDKDAELSDEDETAFSDEIEEYMHELKTYIRTKGITTKVLSSTIPDPSGEFGIISSVIAGTSGIPQRILFGSERGQLASSQDEKNFNSRIKERQDLHAEPNILRPFINKMIEISALPTPTNGYDVIWPDLSTLTSKEKSDVAARHAQAIRNVAVANKDLEEKDQIISRDEYRSRFLDIKS